MRRGTLLILSIIGSALAYAADVNLKTVSKDGKTTYLLEAGAYPHQNNALQLKFKLSSQLHKPVNIDYLKDRSLYLVTVGPISDLLEAQNIQSQMQTNLAIQTIPLKAPKALDLQDTAAAIQNNYNQVDADPSVNGNGNSNTNNQNNNANTDPSAPNELNNASQSNNTLNTANDNPKTNNNNNTPRGRLQINPTAMDNSEKKLWNLRNADIRAVIGEVSRVTGKNFVIDPRVQGKISIISGSAITDRELYQVFLSMLQVSGYAAIPYGEVIKIVPNIDAKTISNFFTRPPIGTLKGDEMLVEVVPVQYVPAEQLVPVLRPLMPQWSSISAYEPSNMLILSGRAANIKRLASIIKQVDTSTSNGIDVVHLRHALAMDVATTLKDLVKGPSAPGGGGGGGGRGATIAADDRSNAILVSGNRTDRIRLRLLIEKLDRGSPEGGGSSTKVVYLHYLRAEDLVPILAGVAKANFSGNVGTTIGTITRPPLDSTNPASSIIGDSTSGAGAATMTPASGVMSSSGGGSGSTNPQATPNTTGAATQDEGSTKPSVQIIAEPNTNSIILNAPPTIIRILRGVIAQLDIKPAQLLIEALVTEVNEADIRDLGIEWGSVENGVFRNGFAVINTKLNVDNFQARINALVQQQKANVLSTPSVMVLDNRQAKILVGRQVSVGTTTYPNNAGGTTTASPFTTFSRVNVALHLYVRPQITQGNGIQMQIDQGNDTIDPASLLTTTTNPVFRVSAIVTSVQIESGDIIVLGGLTQDSLGNDDNRLAILGDIPGIGKLFQHNKRTREKRVLMVFIRPVIVKNERDALELSGSKYNDLRQYQLDWLRTQDYNETNNDVLLPALKQETLPKPFMRSFPIQAQKKILMKPWKQ